jgi:glycerol-3-phosphate dehydrogenase
MMNRSPDTETDIIIDGGVAHSGLFITITGGKLMICRLMAEQATDKV